MVEKQYKTIVFSEFKGINKPLWGLEGPNLLNLGHN